MAKVVVLKRGAGKRMSEEMKALVNDAFEKSEEAEDKELEGIQHEDVRKAREMINEIEEILEEMDAEELTKPNEDYLQSLIMHLGEFVPAERDENEESEEENNG